jgi:hypothetical protein
MGTDVLSQRGDITVIFSSNTLRLEHRMKRYNLSLKLYGFLQQLKFIAAETMKMHRTTQYIQH